MTNSYYQQYVFTAYITLQFIKILPYSLKLILIIIIDTLVSFTNLIYLTDNLVINSK